MLKFLDKTRVKSILDPFAFFLFLRFCFDRSTAQLQHQITAALQHPSTALPNCRSTKLGELARGRKFNFIDDPNLPLR
jgi:hypothetical protein